MGSSFLLILLAVVCSVCGQLVLKLGMTQVGQIGLDMMSQPVGLAFRVLTNPLVVVGLGCYVVGAGIWLTVLSRVPLSLAYPSLALSYALTPLLAWLVLGESVPSLRWLGVAVICAGVFLISRTA